MSSEASSSTEVSENDNAPLLARNSLIADRYRIIEVLGKGGMGVVYKAEQVLINRIVALKMMLAKHTGTSKDYQRFQREAKAASQLDHPNIITLHDFGFAEGQAYLSMDYLEGESLGEILDRSTLSLDSFKNIFVQACDALQHAHEKGIIHRDIKPTNIMVTERRGNKQFVVILDFGLVKLMEAGKDGKLTATDMIVGTPLYMSPEQCRAETVDARSDIYSLACVMYESLTGFPPVVADSMYGLIHKHVTEDPLPISSAVPELNIPKALNSLIMRAIAKDANDRPASMAEFGRGIEDAFGESRQTASSPNAKLAERKVDASQDSKKALLDAEPSTSNSSEGSRTRNEAEPSTSDSPEGSKTRIDGAPSSDDSSKGRMDLNDAKPGSAGGSLASKKPVTLDSEDEIRASHASKSENAKAKSEVPDELLISLSERSLEGVVIDNTFTVLNAIGKGGMSVVYKARYEILNKIVAIKTLHPHLISDIGSLQRFKQEAQAASQLDHSNVIKVYSFGITSGDTAQPYIVMDFIDGLSLSDQVRLQGTLPVADVLRIFVQVCNALTHAHNKGVVHRDLKPSNIMLIDRDGDPYFVKIVDFGIAKIVPQDGEKGHQLTQTGEIFGSPSYMSPEQCTGQVADKRSDVYSLGCVLYEALTGLPPHRGASFYEVFRGHISQIPPALSIPSAEQALINRLEAITFRALEKQAQNRYQSMSEFEADLRKLQRDIESGLKGNDLSSGFARQKRTMQRILNAAPKLLVPLVVSAVFLICIASFAITKCSWFFVPHEFNAPQAHWMEYLRKRHKKQEIDEKVQRTLDLGKASIKLVESMKGLRSLELLHILQERAQYCEQLGAFDDELAAREKIVRILKELGSTGNIEYADACADDADCLIEDGDYKRAVPLLEDAAHIRVKSDLKIPRIYLNLGYALGQLGDFPQSIAQYSNAVSILADSGKATSVDFKLSRIMFALMADEFETKKLWKQAHDNYAKAEAMNQSFSAEGKFKSATKFANELAIAQAYLFMKLGEYKQAEAHFASVMPYITEQLATRPDEFRAVPEAYAYSCWRAGDFLKAVQLKEQFVKPTSSKSKAN